MVHRNDLCEPGHEAAAMTGGGHVPPTSGEERREDADEKDEERYGCVEHEKSGECLLCDPDRVQQFRLLHHG